MSQRYTDVSEVPLALAVFLASDNYDYDDTPNVISATTLLRSLRQIILPSRLLPGMGLTSLPSMMANREGAAIHDGIERAWKENHRNAMEALGYPKRVIDLVMVNPTPEDLKNNPDAIPVYLEQRLKRKLGKWTISGKFDFVGEGRVQDFKRTKVWTYLNQVNNNKYALQGSIYRWLDSRLITQDDMDIHFIFSDWQGSKVRSDPNYPKLPFKTQSFDLISLREIEQFITKKVHQIETYMDAPEEEIPECSDEDLWRSEPEFKYYKNPTKTARSTKNFDNLHDARLRMVEDGSVGLIKEVPGQVTACKYCPAFAVCSQKDRLIAQGELLMA
jgi:hypothetical protein